MRHIGVSSYEQQLSRRAAEALKQMTELKQLRELVRLAEAAKALTAKGLACSPVKPCARPLRTIAAANPSTVRAAIAPAGRIAGSRSRPAASGV